MSKEIRKARNVNQIETQLVSNIALLERFLFIPFHSVSINSFSLFLAQSFVCVCLGVIWKGCDSNPLFANTLSYSNITICMDSRCTTFAANKQRQIGRCWFFHRAPNERFCIINQLRIFANVINGFYLCLIFEFFCSIVWRGFVYTFCEVSIAFEFTADFIITIPMESKIICLAKVHDLKSLWCSCFFSTKCCEH